MTEAKGVSSFTAVSPEAVAAQWAARAMRGPLKPVERKELDAWLARDARNRDALERAKAAYEDAGEAASHPDILAMRSAALGKVRRLSPPAVWGLTLAASVLIAFGLAVALPKRTESPTAIAGANVELGTEGRAPTVMLHRYVTRVGERLSATLADGSVLSLNTDSEVRIDYTSRKRRIELLRGEAMFDVARRPDWPFEVAAGEQVVRALGTVFNVRRRGDDLEVVLIEGHVAVGKAMTIATGDLSKAVQLEAGERLLVSATTVQVAAIDAEVATSWRQGRLSFESTPLEEAIVEINRYRTAPLIIKDSRVAALSLSGTYRTADAMTFENALSAALGISSETTSSGVALVWRNGNAAEPHQ